jgi:hypothetical protein
MSSTPGILLHISGQVNFDDHGVAEVRYSCDSGTFGLLEDEKIEILGAYAKREFGSSPLVHWTPSADTNDGDTVKVSLVGDDGVLAAVEFKVARDGIFYLLLTV